MATTRLPAETGPEHCLCVLKVLLLGVVDGAYPGEASPQQLTHQPSMEHGSRSCCNLAGLMVHTVWDPGAWHAPTAEAAAARWMFDGPDQNPMQWGFLGASCRLGLHRLLRGELKATRLLCCLHLVSLGLVDAGDRLTTPGRVGRIRCRSCQAVSTFCLARCPVGLRSNASAAAHDANAAQQASAKIRHDTDVHSIRLHRRRRFAKAHRLFHAEQAKNAHSRS